jgi:uncharacterized integral membrane protein (TIGR00698 family)
LSEPKPPVTQALPGLLLCAALGSAAFFLAQFDFFGGGFHLSPLLLVILLGMLWRAVLPLPAIFEAGVRVAQRPVLRWGVAGLGFRLSLQELGRIGVPALAVVAISTGAALWFGWWLAKRVGIDRKLGTLLGVGGAICGASAIVAADSVVQGERRDVAVSLGLITLLGTIGIIVYPLLFHALSMTPFLYGVWNGASLHEMAQVVAAGDMVGDEARDVATVSKLARISLLAPVVLYLAWSLRQRNRAAGEPTVAPLPWFLVLFVVFAGFNSFVALPADTLGAIHAIVLWILSVGMAGVGLQTALSDIRAAGVKPLGVATAQWVFLAVLSYALAVWMIGSRG